MNFKEYLAELFIDFDNVKTDAEILRLAISAEHDASNLYDRLSTKTKNEKLNRVLLDISQEEKVHVGEFEALLKIVDKEYEPALKDGSKEISEI